MKKAKLGIEPRFIGLTCQRRDHSATLVQFTHILIFYLTVYMNELNQPDLTMVAEWSWCWNIKPMDPGLIPGLSFFSLCWLNYSTLTPKNVCNDAYFWHINKFKIKNSFPKNFSYNFFNLILFWCFPYWYFLNYIVFL